MGEDYKDLLDTFLKTCTVTIDGKEYMLVESVLAHDVIAYIQRQLNEQARLGFLNDQQEQMLRANAVEDLFILIYVKHYDSYFAVQERGPRDEKGNETLVTKYKVLSALEKDPVFTSANNLMKMLFSRVQRGRDRELEKMRIEASRKVVMPNQ